MDPTTTQSLTATAGDLAQRCRDILLWRSSGSLPFGTALRRYAEDAKFDFHGDDRLREAESATMVEATRLVAEGRVHTLAPELGSPEQWCEAVLDELATTFIDPKSNDPREILRQVIAWNAQVALDPRVSEDAQALVDRGRSEALASLDVDQLAQVIREVDGNHSLGAGALAEAIIERLQLSLPKTAAEPTPAAPLPPAFNQRAFGLSCTVAWTELVLALRADGHQVGDSSGPNTRKWMEAIVRDTFAASTADATTMTVINPEEWEPCSPAYLANGGRCDAPRVWNQQGQNHWHPRRHAIPLSDTFVQQVPDKCDRIVWRGHYYHLPLKETDPTGKKAAPAGLVDDSPQD